MRYKSILLLLGLAAILISPLTVIPTHLERAIVLKSDGYHGAAFALMKDLYRTGSRSEQLVYELTKQHLDFGEIEQASGIISAFSGDRPELDWPRRTLLSIHEAVGTEDERIEALNALHTANPGMSTFRLLAGHYRIKGDIEQETRLIKEAISAGYATTDDRLRLGMVKASMNQVAEAIRILQDIDDKLEDTAIQPRFTLYSLLITSGRPLDAVQYGQMWASRWDNIWATEEFQEIMSAAGYPDLANGIVLRKNES